MKQLFIGGSGTGNLVANDYHPLHGHTVGTYAAPSATESDVICNAVSGFTLRGLKVVLATAPGAGTSRTFTVRKNGASTALVVTISNTATEAELTGVDVVYVAGDTFSLRHTVSGAPVASVCSWTVEVETSGGDTTAIAPISGMGGSGTSSPNFFPVWGGLRAGRSSESADVQIVAPDSGVFTAWRLAVTGASGDRVWDWHIRVNGVNQAASLIQLSVASPGPTVVSGLSIAFNRGDIITVGVAISSGATGQKGVVQGSLEYELTSGGSVIGIANTQGGSTTLVEYGFINPGLSDVADQWLVTSAPPKLIGNPVSSWVVTKLTINLPDDDPGAGTSRTWTFMNGATGATATGLACTISGTAQTGTNDTVVALAATDLAQIQMTPVGSPTALSGNPIIAMVLASVFVPPTPDLTLYVADGASEVPDSLAILLNSASHTPALYFTDDVFGDGSHWRRATSAPGKTRGRWIDADLETTRFAFGYNDNVIYLADESGAVLAVTTAAAALDAGDAPNHGLWIGRALPGLSGVYIVAAEGAVDGTLYKTWDRFASIGKTRPATGGTAVPAGGDAMMVAIGSKGVVPPPPLGQGLYVAQSPFAATQQTFPSRAALLSGAAWTVQFTQVAALQWPVQFTRGYNGLLFRSRGPNAGNGGQNHPGNLERSIDLGVTWTEVFVMQTNAAAHWGVQGLTRAGNGDMYLCTMSDDPANMVLPAPRVYKSVDNGLNWTQVLEDGTLDAGARRQMIDIAAHPFDPQKVHVIGGTGAGARRSWSTLDAGTNWTFTTDAAPTTVTSCERQIVMMSNSRVILMDDAVGNLRYSDDRGATWLGGVTGTQDTGRKKADDVTTVAGVGTLPWANAASLELGGSGGPASVANTTPAKATSDALWASDFGFTVPSDAVIVGVEVRISKHSYGDSSRDGIVQLLNGGAPAGTDKAGTAPRFGNTWTTVTYGGPADLWGLALTPSIVNNSGFGMRYAVTVPDSRTASVSLIDIKVYYTQLNSFTTIAFQLSRDTAGTLAFAAGGSATAPVILRSKNYGAGWVSILNDTKMIADLGVASGDQFAGIVYEPTSKTLYVSTDLGSAATQKVLALRSADADILVPVIDQTVNLNDIFTDASSANRRVSRQGIVVS